MAKEATTLNGGMEIRMVEGKIRRRIQAQCEPSLSSFLIHFQTMISGVC
jgi:hypothetical protein